MHIPLPYLTTQYFTHNFPTTMLIVKLPNTSTRGLLSAEICLKISPLLARNVHMLTKQGKIINSTVTIMQKQH